MLANLSPLAAEQRVPNHFMPEVSFIFISDNVCSSFPAATTISGAELLLWLCKEKPPWHATALMVGCSFPCVAFPRTRPSQRCSLPDNTAPCLFIKVPRYYASYALLARPLDQSAAAAAESWASSQSHLITKKRKSHPLYKYTSKTR